MQKKLAKAMIYALLPYNDYVKTITSDNGLELFEQPCSIFICIFHEFFGYL